MADLFLIPSSTFPRKESIRDTEERLMTSADRTTSVNGRSRALILDDEEVIVLALQEILLREGYEVVAVSNPVEALRHVRERSFAVFLSDQRMPEMSGLEFLAQAREIQPNATRILMTGVLHLDTVIDAINHGEIYRFVVKPWLREELLVTMRNGVQRYELILRNAELTRTTMVMNETLAQLNQSLELQVAREAEHSRKLAELNTALQLNLQRSVELCLRTMETFHPSLGNQARRVREICLMLADSLGLPLHQRQVLEFSAYLHDVGLMSVPRRLIRLWQCAPSELNAAELGLVQQHPILGQELVGFMHHLSEVGGVIRLHHERFDGSGFPDGLEGEAIPLLARVIAIAASYVENSIDDIEGLERIERGSGVAFDPELVRLFLKTRPHAVRPRKERQVLLSELDSGMVMAKGIYTANGLLLVPEGQVLNKPLLEKLRNHNRVSPIRQMLAVYC